MSELNNFLDALYGASQAAIRLTFEEDSEREVATGAEIEAVVKDAAGAPIYAFAEMANGDFPFVYGMTENATPEEWEDYNLRPTVALFKDGTLLTVWALVDEPTDNDIWTLANTGSMGFDPREPIPTPGANGWEMVHCDPEEVHEIAALVEAYGEATDDPRPAKAPAVSAAVETASSAETAPWDDEPAAAPGDLGVYGDATVRAPYDESDPIYAREMVIATGAGRDSTNWTSKTMPIGQLVALLSRHPENAKKDGPAFVLADIAGTQRRKVAVKACYGVGLDIDVGTSGARIDAALAKLGCLAIRYTTHSHGKTRTEISKDRLIKAAAKDDATLDEAYILKFLREHEHWDEAIVASAEYAGDEHQPTGLMALITHTPMPKHRVVMPLAAPFVITEVAKTHAEGMNLWTQVPKALARMLGDLPLDKSGVDPSRLFYFPRHAKGKPWETSLFGGPLLDWKTLDLEEKVDTWEALVQEMDKGKGKSKTDGGKKLGRWSIKAASGFQIAEVIRDHADDRIRTNGSTKIDIECPFDEDHSNPGDPEDRACMAVNAGDGPSEIFTIKCQHDSCAERTNLDMLGKMLADGWFPESVLEDDTYNNALTEDAPPPSEAAAKIIKEDEAREEYQMLLDDLTPESPEKDVEEAIRAVLTAGLTPMLEAKAQGVLKSKLKLPAATLTKMIKAVGREIAKENNESGEQKDPLGRAIFAFSGDFNFDEAFQVCFKALLRVNELAGEPVFSCLQDKIVRLKRTDEGRLSFEEMNARSLWAELNERVTFVRKSDQGDGVRGPVPKEVADHVYETAYQRLPQTPEVIYTPLYTDKRSLVVDPGWYKELGLIMADTGFEVPAIPSPQPEDVQAAVRWFREEILVDFPFLDHDVSGVERRDPSEANAMAMILTPFMRRMIKSCTPVFFVSKPTPGTGGTFLAKVPMMLFDGQESAPLRYTQNEEEMQKALLASILEARSHLFYDDVKEFNSRSLLQSLTAKTIGGRLLGSTRTIERPNRFNWISTGNNPIVGSEMERRICWIRLNARTADIQNRVYRHENYEQFLLETRDISVFHILVLIENWIAQGMPLFKERKRASFEDWSEKVGGVLMCAGIEGFLDNRRTAGADQDETAIRQFVREWLRRFQYEPTTSSKLFEHATGIDADILDGNTDDQKKQRFHKKMHTLDGRVFALDGTDYMVATSFDDDGGLTYTLSPLHDTDEAAEPIAA
jgi:hypothetical protein